MLLSSEIVIDESINDADIRKALQHAGAAALCQPAAENGEKNHAAIDGEPRQRDFAFGFVHTPTLSQSRDASVARRQLAHRLFQVLEAAEEGEVVPGGGLVLHRNELRDTCQRTAAMAEARRDIARDVHSAPSAVPPRTARNRCKDRGYETMGKTDLRPGHGIAHTFAVARRHRGARLDLLHLAVHSARHRGSGSRP